MNRKKGLPNYPGSKQLYVLLSVLMIAEAAAILAQAYFLARSITWLFQGREVEDVVTSIILFGISFMIKHVIVVFEQIYVEKFSERTVVSLRKKLIQSYFELGPTFIQVNGTGKLVTLAIEGIEQIKEYFELTVPKLIRIAIVPVILVIYVAFHDAISAVIFVVTVPIIVVFMILLGMAAQKMADKQYESYRVLSNHFIDTLKGIETLKYLGKSKSHEAKIGRVSKQYRKATMQTLRVAFLSSFALDFFISLSIAFVAVGLGIRLIDGTIVLLPALTILILAPEYFLPIRQVGSGYHATLNGQLSLANIEAIIEECEQYKKKYLSETINKKNTAIQPWNDESTFELKDVFVTHNNNDTATLSNINFSWKGNGCIGIVGESGSGKSTLIDVLAGFLPISEGNIKINGKDLKVLQSHDWLLQTAYIPQQPYIFPMTLKENLCFYEKDATDEEVEVIIDKIGLRSFVQELPNGINEKIGEGGRSVSGGQEQRIAIARALLSKRSIILLDEPTAHLDIETEFEMLDDILQLFKDRFVFLATHRLHWMKHMDYVLVLDEGKVVEQGTYHSLRNSDGYYKQLIISHTGGEGLQHAKLDSTIR